MSDYDVRGLTSPYPGLRPFTYVDRDLFAGREREIRAAVDLLIAGPTAQAVLCVTGVSGSGKSSLAQAGIVPALEEAYAARGEPSRRALMRPGTRPLAALAAALDALEWPLVGAFAAADGCACWPSPPSCWR